MSIIKKLLQKMLLYSPPTPLQLSRGHELSTKVEQLQGTRATIRRHGGRVEGVKAAKGLTTAP